MGILFDLAGHMAHNRLLVFARKPAPIQITWAGSVGTTGLTSMDYLRADSCEVPPGAERHYREQVLRMPDGYVCYDPPAYSPAVAPLPALVREALEKRLAQQHDERLRALGDARAARVVDKMPDNYLYLGFLTTLFPRATFIHCRRDLRDVAVSCWMTDFGAIPWANDPAHISHRFSQYRRIMEHWRAVLPVPLHEIDYEEVVADLEGSARRLVAACGMDWEPACLEFYRTSRPVRTASVVQVREPVYTRSVARWRNYERDLAELFAALSSGDESSSR